MFCNKELEQIDLPNVEEIDSIGIFAEKLNSVSMPELQKVQTVESYVLTNSDKVWPWKKIKKLLEITEIYEKCLVIFSSCLRTIVICSSRYLFFHRKFKEILRFFRRLQYVQGNVGFVIKHLRTH